MKLPEFPNWSRLALSAAAGLILAGATGCQTNIGGQSLPSAYFLSDDVQFFPAGPQDKIYNERRALEQYKAGPQEPLTTEVQPPPARRHRRLRAPAQPPNPGP